MLLPSQLSYEESVVDLFLAADCTPELHCQHNTWLYISEQYSVHFLRSSCSSVRFFQGLSWIVEDLFCFSEDRSFTSWYALMLLFLFRKVLVLRIEYLSSPLLSSLPSKSCCFLRSIFSLLLLHTASSSNLSSSQRSRTSLVTCYVSSQVSR